MASLIRPFALLSLAAGALSLRSNEDSSVPHAGKRDLESEALFARAPCKDNLGRCFNPTGSKSSDIASRAAATAFCSSFLAVPVVTSTIGTTTPVTTITVTATVQAPPVIQTSIVISNVGAIESVLTTLKSTTTVTPSPLAKRQASASAPPPACATGASYSPAQYSSACACVSVKPSTTYVTATAPLATNTAAATLSVTTTTVTVETSVVTTGTATLTVTSLAVETIIATTCENTANPFNSITGKTFTLYCGRFYNGNEISVTTAPTYSACIETCAALPGCAWGYWVAPTSDYSDKLFCYLNSNAFDSANLRVGAGGANAFTLNA